MNNTSLKRILIVDDSPENIAILTSTLKDYKKSIALNGLKALKIAFSYPPPDLILLDIIMPEMNGFEVCRQLKADERTKNIPVIFLTGKSDTESIIQGFEMGAADYVTKPFNTSELLIRVNTQMALKKSKDEIIRYVLEIENKNELITSSINYASVIQNAILPKREYLDEVLREYFILYKPKDIVSGDFYWSKKIGEKIIIIVADCTGHGVPGAFMSMFGFAFLNEIVGKDNISSPNKILEKLRGMIIHSLGQDCDNNVKDGMDMAVVSIDNSLMTVEFAGAYNPLYLVRNQELTQIKPDRMPVSVYDRMHDFTNHTIELKQGDQLYLFTDGFVDQFGGPYYKKFMSPPFRNLIIKNSDKPMSEQKRLMEKAFDDWKGKHEQIDDVSVLGIKI